jgi:hypothetical protein
MWVEVVSVLSKKWKFEPILRRVKERAMTTSDIREFQLRSTPNTCRA